MKLPDGPKISPFLQSIKWVTEPYEFLDDCTKRYADLYTMRLLGFPPMVMVSNPKGIEEIFIADSQSFDAGSGNEYIRPLFGDNSVALLDGEPHKRERKLLMPPFHGKKIQSYADSICQITQKVASQWQTNKSFVTIDTMQEITLEVIIQVVFGLTEGERYEQIKILLIEWMDSIGTPVGAGLLFLKFLQKDWGQWSPWGKLMHSQRKIYDILKTEIKERRANIENQGNDILSLMLSATYSDGQPITEEHLCSEMLTMLAAGHESTANSLTWAFYWIHSLPEVREKLVQEIDKLGENPNSIELSKLPYLTAVCQETLRISPAFLHGAARTAKSTIEIMGHKFEAGTTLVASIYSTHHREDIYPNPKQFLPERFIDRNYSPYEFIPFGGGSRLCVGYALAMLEMKLVLGTVLSRYQLALANNQPVKPKRRGPAVSPSDGVPMITKGKRVAKAECGNAGSTNPPVLTSDRSYR